MIRPADANADGPKGQPTTPILPRPPACKHRRTCRSLDAHWARNRREAAERLPPLENGIVDPAVGA